MTKVNLSLRRVVVDSMKLLTIRRKSRSELPKELSTVLQSYGLIGIKISQILSTRFDLVPADEREALRFSWDNVGTIDLPQMIEDLELSEEQRHLIESADEIPIGSASVAQVYKSVRGRRFCCSDKHHSPRRT